MFSNFVSNLFWGSSRTQQNEDDAPVDHVIEEQGDWLVIDYTAAGENESVASETSWVISPSPRFRRSSSATSSLKGQSMENLLLECPPSLSLYQQHQGNATATGGDSVQSKELVLYDKSKRQVAVKNQNRQLVVYRRKKQMELATQMGIPLTRPPRVTHEPSVGPTVPKITKKSTHKHNQTNMRITRGKKVFKIHQCGVKAGRRRN